MSRAKAGRAPRGPNAPGLPTITRNTSEPWRCRVCSYFPNLDRVSRQCIGCGRDFWGNPGTVPEVAANIHHARESGAT